MKMMMNQGGIAMTNSFLLADEASGQTVLFDAPNDTVAPLLDAVESHGWTLQGLWLTHGHFDHLADHAVVKKRFPAARILIHALDEPRLSQPGSSLFPLPFVIPPGKADALLQDGQKLAIGNVEVEVMHTPGHAPGHVMYYLPSQKLLVGGDLIIGGSIGRTDIPGADPRALAKSVRQVMQLPDETELLPGHGEPSTLGAERANNPYVQMILAGRGVD
jgi:glyoxylase-like metal-dependent hydrolase (beta-lactamase superfamily II)